MSAPKWLTLLYLPIVVSLVARGSEPAATPEPTAETTVDEAVFGMIPIGPKDDHGWSEAHYSAGKYVEANVSGSRMIALESLNPDAQREMTLEPGRFRLPGGRRGGHR